ncbi:carbohydrate ABC transporter permease [Nonomuraea sp. NPDC050556]|uniref:carbohydrate ABC transporter permease n=1 Tax=Nonomuraea sp. NPDC050556 TaxID=3364369 RepID=UPI00378CBC0A
MKRSKWAPAIFIGPAFLWLCVFFLAPMVTTVWVSLTSQRAADTETEFVGLKNYLKLARDPYFLSTFWAMLKILVIGGIAVFALSFLFMVVLREMRWKKFARGVMFVPYIVIPVALAIMWGVLLNPEDGLLNSALDAVGLKALAQVWLGPDWIFTSIMGGLIWISTGFYTTLLFAGVDRIPATFYEAAQVEGAGRWQRFRHVTIPMTWDVIGTAAVLWVIGAINTFGFIFAFSGAGATPDQSTWTPAIYLYIETFDPLNGSLRYGYGCAIAVVLTLLVSVSVLLVRRVFRREAIQF